MKKLSLTNLKVTSFVTELQRDHAFTIQGGIEIRPRPRTFGCPSVNDVSCLPPKSDGCFSEGEGNCTLAG